MQNNPPESCLRTESHEIQELQKPNSISKHNFIELFIDRRIERKWIHSEIDRERERGGAVVIFNTCTTLYIHREMIYALKGISAFLFLNGA